MILFHRHFPLGKRKQTIQNEFETKCKHWTENGCFIKRHDETADVHWHLCIQLEIIQIKVDL